MHVPSGLVPRLAAAARRAGSRVEIQDRAEPPIPASAPDITNLDEDGRRLVAALAGNRRGVILVRSPGKRMAAIELALRVFPTGRFMIVTKTRSEARKIAEALRADREEPVACYTRQCTTSDVRIQVGTAGGLDLTYASIVLFTDATQILQERVRDSTAHPPSPANLRAARRSLRLQPPRAAADRGIRRPGHRAARPPGRGAGQRPRRLRGLVGQRAAGRTAGPRMEEAVRLATRRTQWGDRPAGHGPGRWRCGNALGVRLVP